VPITKSAKKSLKVSRTKEKQNEERRILLEKALKKVSKENVNEAISLIDKAAKIGIIHKNKAARLKSRLAKKFGTPKQLKAKNVNVKSIAKSVKAKTKKTTKKTAKK